MIRFIFKTKFIIEIKLLSFIGKMLILFGNVTQRFGDYLNNKCKNDFSKLIKK